jgi:predicted transcriptional regulator of viral defense system
MKNLEVLQILQQTGKRIFTLPEIKNLFNIEKDNSAYKKVASLIRDGVLTKTINGIYFLASKPPVDFELANYLCQPSYISLSSALNYYGILIQVPYEITSVTARLTRKVEVNNKLFSYRHIQPAYFSGYQKEQDFLIAEPAKALIDTLFLTSLGKLKFDFDELSLKGIDQQRFKELAGKIRNRAFQKFIERFKL